MEIDCLRVRLGRWYEHGESRQIARDLGYDLARRHLSLGRDVVLPQLTVRADVVDDLERLAADVGAAFVEVILIAVAGELAARVQPRRETAGERHPRDLFTPAELATQIEDSLDALAAIAVAHASAHTIDVGGMTPDRALAAVRGVVS